MYFDIPVSSMRLICSLLRIVCIAIRHNTVLDDFFQKEEYDLEEIEPQLSYSMELFQSGIWWNVSFLLLLEFICLIMGMNVFMSTIMPPHWLPGENRSENTKTCSRNLKVPVTSTPVCLIKDELNIFFRIYDEKYEGKKESESCRSVRVR